MKSTEKNRYGKATVIFDSFASIILFLPQACLISKFNLFLTVSSVSFPNGAAAETIVLRLSILCLSTMGCFANPRMILK